MIVMSEPRRATPIGLVIIHSNEGDHKPNQADDRTAENLAGYLERECAAGRGKSYHKVVDNDSTVTVVPDDRAAWAAKGANRRSLNICLIGWARWSRAEWLMHLPMIIRAATEVRQWCRLHGIPLTRITPYDVRAGKRGVIGHIDWSNSDLDDSDHTDPGPNFPWDVLLGKIAVDATVKSKELLVSIYLPPTPIGGPGNPDRTWPAREVTDFVSGSVRVVFGAGGAWIQAAWWGERGQDIVPKDKPIHVEQFKIQRWKAPDWAEYLVIRYAAPAGGSAGLVG